MKIGVDNLRVIGRVARMKNKYLSANLVLLVRASISLLPCEEW
jgi:hypothetical protein